MTIAEKVVISVSHLELAAEAARSGMVLLPAPLPGYQYVTAKAFNESKYKDSDGVVKNRFPKEKKHFAKFYGEVWEALGMRKVLSPNEVYCLTLLFPYCEINTNFLISKDDNKIPLDISDIATVIDREDRQTRRIIKSLVDKNLIAKVESGGCFKYCVNPELYWNGGDTVQYSYFKTMFYTFKEDKVKPAKQQLRALNVNGQPTSIIYLPQKKTK